MAFKKYQELVLTERDIDFQPILSVGKNTMILEENSVIYEDMKFRKTTTLQQMSVSSPGTRNKGRCFQKKNERILRGSQSHRIVD